MNFQDCLTLSNTRKRKMANNTYLLIHDNGTFGIKLHNTEIVTFTKTGKITLNTGGWQTVTTKDRINRYSGIQVYSTRGVWFADWHGKTYTFKDGITFYPSGNVTGTGPDPAKIQKLRKQVVKFARDYTQAFVNGEIDKPGGSDCWICLMEFPNAADHIHSHIKENYFVPSILTRVKDRLSPIACDYIGSVWYGNRERSSMDYGYLDTVIQDQIRKSVKWYCLNQLGLAT